MTRPPAEGLVPLINRKAFFKMRPTEGRHVLLKI
uniref:Uncharacterized protein n=1 Tax=Anguilla anguilla TaxID=7936 RepID=A0A0E9VNF1_ANGAN